MGRLGDSDWWWEYALDGVVGGVIGGAVTALAVWLTLRHERRLANESHERALASSDQANARSNAMRVQSVSTRLNFAFLQIDPAEWTPGFGPTQAELADHVLSFMDEVLTLRWLLRQRWPATSEQLGDAFTGFLDRLKEEEFPGHDDMSDVLSDVGALAAAWGAHPEQTERAQVAKRSGVLTTPGA